MTNVGIDIFQPLKYEIPYPPPFEFSIIINSAIEKIFVEELTCGQFIRMAEGYFRIQSRRAATPHNMYVQKKMRGMYDVVKNTDPKNEVIRIDYSLTSGLVVYIYVLAVSRKMIGGVIAYQNGILTDAKYREIWGTDA